MRASWQGGGQAGRHLPLSQSHSDADIGIEMYHFSAGGGAADTAKGERQLGMDSVGRTDGPDLLPLPRHSAGLTVWLSAPPATRQNITRIACTHYVVSSRPIGHDIALQHNGGGG